LLDRWLATLIELEQNCISPFIILTFCSSEFVEFLIGYSPPSSHIRTFYQPNSNLGGSTYLLQIWIWEHIPIRRVHRGRVLVSSLHLVGTCLSFDSLTMSTHYSCYVFQNWTHGDYHPPSATFGWELSRFGGSRNDAACSTPMTWMC
jgi:hypothetical protein